MFITEKQSTCKTLDRNKLCSFPFIHNHITYYGCSVDDHADLHWIDKKLPFLSKSKAWCPTDANEGNGFSEFKSVSYCQQNCPGGKPTDLVFSKCANSKILILKFHLVCSFSNKLCNVHGTTSECSQENCKCKSSYTGNRCEFCDSKSVIWTGMNGTIEPKSGLGVECGKFKC